MNPQWLKDLGALGCRAPRTMRAPILRARPETVALGAHAEQGCQSGRQWSQACNVAHLSTGSASHCQLLASPGSQGQRHFESGWPQKVSSGCGQLNLASTRVSGGKERFRALAALEAALRDLSQTPPDPVHTHKETETHSVLRHLQLPLLGSFSLYQDLASTSH